MAEGRMLIKAASLVTLDDANGEEMNQGEMMRYLSEIMWFPSAFLEEQHLLRGHRRSLGSRHPDRPGQDGDRDAPLRHRGKADRVPGPAIRRCWR
jgi:hypothetical protein